MKTKLSVALAAIGLLALLIAIDIIVSEAPNPYVQPPVLSLGSGEAASGTMCTVAPGLPGR